ncbi:ankyrin repeat-containing domain protein [Trichoderma pleuroticola]
MFLLAQLYFEVVKNKRTQKKIKDVLKDLPTGHNAYDYVYEEAMKRIMSQVSETAELAKLVLSWIVCAKRPLKALELQHALAVERQKYHIDEENLLPIGDMATICAGLVTIEEESGIIRLIHYTTHKYLERTLEQWLPDAESEITTMCTTYLSLNDFETGPGKQCQQVGPTACRTGCEFQRRLQSFPLYDYAANHWGDHARACSKLNKEVIGFLNCKSNVGASVQALIKRWPRSCHRNTLPMEMTGLHLASYLGINEAVNVILQYEAPIDPRDSHGATPLSYAARNGHKDVVKLFLATDKSNPALRDNNCRTPLLYAAMNGHEGVVKLLLTNGKVDPDLMDNFGRTPLSYAAMAGHEDVVKLLLETDKVDPNYWDGYHRTPLLYAAMKGHVGVVKLLLATERTNPDLWDSYHNTPLLYAVMNGYEAIVKLLFETGKVNPNFKNADNKKPLSSALILGHVGIAKLLLATEEINPDFWDSDRNTPLSYAVRNKEEDIVKLLLKTGKVDSVAQTVDLPIISNIMSQTKWTPLSLAIYTGHESIVKLLVTADIPSANLIDENGLSPLAHAVRYQKEYIFKLLLAEDKISVNLPDKDGRTPLTYAVMEQQESMVKLLLAEDTTSITLADNYGWTPLSIAIAVGYEAIVKMLVAAEITRADLIDKDGRTPLAHAVIFQEDSILKLLLAEDVTSINLPDKYGRTPLSYAAECGYRRGVKLILATGRVDRNQLRDAHIRTPLFFAAENGHIDIVKKFLTMDIPIGSTYGYEHRIYDSKQYRSSLKRLVNRHIRTISRYSVLPKYRRRENTYALRPRRRVKRSSYIRWMRDGSMKRCVGAEEGGDLDISRAVDGTNHFKVIAQARNRDPRPLVLPFIVADSGYQSFERLADELRKFTSRLLP